MKKNIKLVLVALTLASLLNLNLKAGDIVVSGLLYGFTQSVQVTGVGTDYAGVAVGNYNGQPWTGYCLDPNVYLYVGQTYTMAPEPWTARLSYSQAQEVSYVMSLGIPADAYHSAVDQSAVWEAVGWNVEGQIGADAAALLAQTPSAQVPNFSLLHDSDTYTQDLTTVPEPGCWALMSGVGMLAWAAKRKLA